MRQHAIIAETSAVESAVRSAKLKGEDGESFGTQSRGIVHC
jgi:hypothetical protein